MVRACVEAMSEVVDEAVEAVDDTVAEVISINVMANRGKSRTDMTAKCMLHGLHFSLTTCGEIFRLVNCSELNYHVSG